MEGHHRIAHQGGVNGRRGVRGVVLHCLPWVMLTVLLAACSAPAGESAQMSDGQAAIAQPATKLAIVVNLAVGEDADAGSETDSVSAVTTRVMKELKSAMTAEDLGRVRTFGALPIIALIADGALIARLLAMPEVLSVERDREFTPLGLTSGKPRFE